MGLPLNNGYMDHSLHVLKDGLAKWLLRLIRNQFLIEGVGSSPTVVALIGILVTVYLLFWVVRLSRLFLSTLLAPIARSGVFNCSAIRLP
jgi:hypothetical protein